MPDPIIVELSNDLPDLEAYLVGITHIHASCIEYDKTEATFIPPLSYPRVLQYWYERFDECVGDTRRIWVELSPVVSRKAQLASPFADDNTPESIRVKEDPDQDYEVAGVVALHKRRSETGPFRAHVHKLLVSPNHRQKGIARRLMAVLERAALKEGLWNLVLDTEVGSAAEAVYPKLGYISFGVVPDYGYSPVPGKMCDERFFYKDLRHGTL